MRTAVIMTSEESTQIGELIDHQPLVLLPIAGRPLLDHVIMNLVHAEIRMITLCLGRRGSAIASYAGDGGRWGAQINYLTAPEDLGSGGTLRWMAPSLRGPTVIIPADRMLRIAPRTLLEQREHTAPTVLTMLDRSGAAVPAAYILTPDVLEQLPKERWDLEHDLANLLQHRTYDLVRQNCEGYIQRLQTVADYQRAQRDFLQFALTPPTAQAQREVDLPGRMLDPGVIIGRGSRVHPSAQLHPPLLIGHHCWIGPDTEIGPDTVIGDECVIDSGATISESTVMRRTYIGRLTHVRERIVDQLVLIDPGRNLRVSVDDPLLLGSAQGSSSRLRSLSERLLALLLFVAAAPLLLLFGILILLTVHTWPFRYGTYVGVRPGQTPVGKPMPLRLLEFTLLADNGTPSPIGRLIWALDLHHLPRLWNVVRGDLALIGVRPLSAHEAERLTETWHQTRYRRPAGFTGLWYIQPHETYDLESIVAADVYYAVAAGRRDQAMILLKTLPAWLRRHRRTEAREPLIALAERLV